VPKPDEPAQYSAHQELDRVMHMRMRDLWLFQRLNKYFWREITCSRGCCFMFITELLWCVCCGPFTSLLYHCWCWL